MLMNLATALAEAGKAVSVTDQAASAASTASNTATAAPGSGDMISMILMMVVMVAVFYFMLIRPQRKKDKQVKEMLNNLKHGDRITTIGGIYGTITGIKDDTITLAVGQKGGAPMEMTVARWAIRQVEEVSVENEGEILA